MMNDGDYMSIDSALQWDVIKTWSTKDELLN